MYFYLKNPKSINNTLIYIIFYVKADKKNFKYSTGQNINPDNWDFENRFPKLKRGTPGKKNKHISNVLTLYKSTLENILKDYETNNKKLYRLNLREIFDNEFKNEKPITILEKKSTIVSESIQSFIDIKSKSKGVSRGWKNKYLNLKNKIILFDTYKNNQTHFSDLNTNWVDEYCGFLRELPILLEKPEYLLKVKSLDLKLKLPKSPYNDNTLNRHIIYLFTFLNWIKETCDDISLNKIKNPVKDFESDDIHLTSVEIKSIEELNSLRPSLEKVRDLFLIGVYSGQRFSDYSVFEKSDLQGDIIIKRSEKTERDSFIPLHTKLKLLLDKYDWKLPQISGQKFNPHIKEICRIAKITEDVKKINYTGNKKEINYIQKCDMVSSHTARRTFITLSSERGMPDHIIMKITGIRDPNTLLKYKKTNQQIMSDFVKLAWE